MRKFHRLSFFALVTIIVFWLFFFGGMSIFTRGGQNPTNTNSTHPSVVRTLKINGRGMANVGYYRGSLNKTDVFDVSLPYSQDFYINEGEFVKFSISSKESDGYIECILNDKQGSELSRMSSRDEGPGYGIVRCSN